jgi:SAM-dependent methyltransferase
MDVSVDRIGREQAFHDARFAGGEDDRSVQMKYYVALKPCFDRYAKRRAELAKGAVVLEYGCAHGGNAIALSGVAKRVEGIDLSKEAVDAGNAEIAWRGIANVKLSVQNAEAMDFADGTFDVVYGSGILHHLDYAKAMAELRRVLKPGGVVLFTEPLGHNPAIEFYRKRTPGARTPDEHPLLVSDFQKFDATFEHTDVRLYGLTSLGSVPFRRTPLLGLVRGIGSALDAVLLRVPGLKWWAWYALMEGKRV